MIISYREGWCPKGFAHEDPTNQNHRLNKYHHMTEVHQFIRTGGRYAASSFRDFLSDGEVETGGNESVKRCCSALAHSHRFALMRTEKLDEGRYMH